MSKPTKQTLTLSPKRKALLEKLLQEEKIIDSEARRIPRRSSQGSATLSYSQQRVWLINELEPDNIAYNDTLALRLKGMLNVAALKQSIQEIVNRHEILRTTFCVVNGEPVQIIVPSLNIDLPVVDLENLPGADREVLVQQLATEEGRVPFKITRTPLLRTLLFKISKSEHLFLLVIHHIVSDGWSLGIFIKEMAASYEAMIEGRANKVEDLPIQYADYAAWQREWMQGEYLNRQLDYWKQQLSGGSTVLELPTDYQRPMERFTR
jgi:hypothetical protein